jgi:hypothetical protein
MGKDEECGLLWKSWATMWAPNNGLQRTARRAAAEAGRWVDGVTDGYH